MMESLPGTSKQPCSPPKKRPLDTGHLQMNEKQAMINLYKQLVAEVPALKPTAIVSKICISMGVAKSTVYRILKEYKETGTVIPSEHLGGRPAYVDTFGESVKTSVRKLVHSFFFRNELPTINKILVELKKCPELPQMSRSSLYKFLKQINFKYLKGSRKSVLIERDDIIRWRRKYLRDIKKFRKEGRAIYYLDETWVNEGHTKAKLWVDDNIRSRRQAFIEGLSTGIKRPSGKGKRLIVVHAGSAEGFVEGGLYHFQSKRTVDYHEEMNSNVFEKWFKDLLLKLPDNAVIVMDNASYHSRRLETIPTTASKKKDMQEWLQSKGVEFEETMVRSELLHLIKLHKDEYNLYVTDEMAKSNQKHVLRLPPYHCELNPIELIWAQVKGEVAAKNTTFKLSDVEQLLINAINNVTPMNWNNCVAHVIKEEDKMCKLDGIIDDLVEPIIISVGVESSSESSDEDS